MLLTITSTAVPATDLGFLLHKNPANVHQVSLPFGDVHVFYPEASDERCTAAMLISVNPVELVRVARKPLRTTDPEGQSHAARSSNPPLRPAAGSRRREALLHRAGRGRKASAPWRRLAGGTSRERSDRQAIPGE